MATDPFLIQQDQLLLAWIFSAIFASVLPQITASRTSYEAWTTLEGIFNTRSKLCIIQLQNQLRNLQKDSLSVDEYFAKLTSMTKELWEADVVVDDGELSLITLNGLEESYDPFVTAQTACVEDISFSSLLGLLRSYEARLNRHSEITGIATANAIHSSSNVMICQIYDKKEHMTLSCYNRHNEQCFPSKQCKLKGHFRSNRESKDSAPAANAVWYPDNGASDRVTSDSSAIQATDAEQTLKVLTVANGSIGQGH